MPHQTNLYFEAHITIEPVFGKDLERLTGLVEAFGFRVADLLMKKRKTDTAERSQYDTFCTTRSKDYTDIEYRTLACAAALELAHFDVWRYKIENTLLDVRMEPRGNGSSKSDLRPRELKPKDEGSGETTRTTLSVSVSSPSRF